jgi:uncharacterized protein YeaC (DUF1315 family)
MKKIFDSRAFSPQEDLGFYLDPKKVPHWTWYEPATKKELTELFTEWPHGTKLSDVFPHCKDCFTYPNLKDNIYLYRKLTESKEFKGLFDPLDYFNLLYQQLKYCLDNVNSDKKDIVIDHLTGLNLVKRKLHFFLYSLHYLINGLNGSPVDTADWPEGIWLVKNENLARMHLNIINEYKMLEKELLIDTGSEIIKNVRSEVITKLIGSSEIIQRLTQPQIALIYVYERKLITKGNCSEIANKYGFFNSTSGEGLRQDFEFYRSDANRHSVPTTKKKFNNKIILFESITGYLNDKAKEWAFDEIKLLKKLLKNNDW